MSNEKDHKKAKVTPETLAESARLKEIWSVTPDRPSQAEFGEKFGIGSQSAVTLFLNGKTPLSLKAARGFAKGLGCAIADFSPRLAAEAGLIAETVSLSHSQAPRPELTPEESEVLILWRQLSAPHKSKVLNSLRHMVEKIQADAEMTGDIFDQETPDQSRMRYVKHGKQA